MCAYKICLIINLNIYFGVSYYIIEIVKYLLASHNHSLSCHIFRYIYNDTKILF